MLLVFYFVIHLYHKHILSNQSIIPLEHCQIEWRTSMECYFQASPEMFERVQDRALAWGLKGRKSWTEDNVSLKGGPSAHMMLSIMKKWLSDEIGWLVLNMRMLTSWNSLVVPFQNDGGHCASFTQDPRLYTTLSLRLGGSSVLPSLLGFDSDMCYQMGDERIVSF